MDIYDFKNYFNYTILNRGFKYYRNNKVQNLSVGGGYVKANIWGTYLYTVTMKISHTGEVWDFTCDCPYGGLCKHIAATLYLLRDEYGNQLDYASSNDVQRLISVYHSISEYTAAEATEFNNVHIVPELRFYMGNLVFTLKIGRDRMYIVKDIDKLVSAFRYRTKVKYGKELEFVHTYNAIDKRSRAVMELAHLLSRTGEHWFNQRREFELTRSSIDSFFDLFRDDYVMYNSEMCFVKYENPKITFHLQPSSNNRFMLSTDQDYVFFGRGHRACFFNKKTHTFYLADPEFSELVSTFFSTVAKNTELYISEDDMPAFCSSVIKSISEYVTVTGIETAEEFFPPEAVARLYLDCGEENEIFARLEFAYDDEVFVLSYIPPDNPIRDYRTETIAEAAVMKYFDFNLTDEVHPLYIDDERKIYELLTSGLPTLTKIMEVYASDRFKRLSVRPPAHAAVGVRPTGNMLNLEITAEGYTNEELVDILSAYRRGSKYHRLRDGSFAVIDDSWGELDTLTKNLNITDKALIKANMNVPKYRMLYLDSLKNNKCLKLKRNNDFKNLIRSYNLSTEDSENYAVPDSLSSVMRDYQHYGFRWMKTIAAFGFGGILADDMGLGKTIQAIALVLDAKQKSDKHTVNLVVCPSSLTLNWANEIEKFAPQLNTLVITGLSSERQNLIKQINDYDIAVTSYSLLTRDIAEYEDIHFNMQFIDEAQYIKNHNTQMAKACKAIKSDVRFALTGTPVENSLAELWSIFDFIMPDYLFAYSNFKKKFEKPIVSKKDKNAVGALQEIVSPFILRRLKKDVLTELPDKTETVLYTKLEGEQSRIYSANVAELRAALSKGISGTSERFKILAMLTRLRQICCDPSLVYENYKGDSAKLEQCAELIESCTGSGHKILLFSQFTSMLDIIHERLTRMGISCYILTGKTKATERIKLVNSFNEDDTQVFLISLKAGGTGLNLTGADIVIHYDPWWNISAENQASDRAYRIGQKNNVQIYKLITDKTVEENIRKLQLSKKELSDIAVNGDGDIMHMSAEDIMAILN